MPPGQSADERLIFECPVCGCVKDAYDIDTGTIFKYRMCWNRRGHGDPTLAHLGSKRMWPIVVRVVQR